MAEHQDAPRPHLPLALAVLGLVGTLATLAITITGGTDWGSPGSPGYASYEFLNRLNGVALAMVAAAPLGLRSALVDRPDARGVRRTLTVVAGAFVGLVIGSVAEFWLFTDQPYRGAGGEGRNAAWNTFLLSDLALMLASVAAGVGLVRRRLVPRAFGLSVALAAPVGIGAAVFGAPLLLNVPLVGLAMLAATISVRQSPEIALQQHPELMGDQRRGAPDPPGVGETREGGSQ